MKVGSRLPGLGRKGGIRFAIIVSTLRSPNAEQELVLSSKARSRRPFMSSPAASTIEMMRSTMAGARESSLSLAEAFNA
jgi:hypothetical protein